MATKTRKRRYTMLGNYIAHDYRVRVCACNCGRKFVPTRPKQKYATRRCAWRVASRARDARRPVCSECGRKLPRTVKAKRNGRSHNGRNGGHK